MNHYQVVRISDGVTLSAYFAEVPALPDLSWGDPSTYTVNDLGPIDPARALWLCHDLRVQEYPSAGDQLDAAHKARAGDPSQQQALDAQIIAVKAKYPKPSAP